MSIPISESHEKRHYSQLVISYHFTSLFQILPGLTMLAIYNREGGGLQNGRGGGQVKFYQYTQTVKKKGGGSRKGFNHLERGGAQTVWRKS